ncbi:MAG: lipopolysaccharide biosynthesis protein RfbH [Nitrospira sp.]|nr:lipopolysaccharide biosynthesis protein RfbH [Nitrospinaceae bacterium]
MKDGKTEALREKILRLVEEYAVLAHSPEPFSPGVTAVPVSGKVYGAKEMRTLVDSALDFWLTTGRFNDAFEKKLAAFLGVRHVLTTNSGSSANLLAVSALTSPLLGEKALKPGDEVLTVAAAFPTTVNPLFQNGLVPVFLDVDIPTYNVKSNFIEQAVTEKTRAIMLAHTLGNPFDLKEVTRVAKKYNLWLIEDCCDALGSTYGGQMVGSFGDIGTLSFYPAHHITMGEGGAIFTNSGKLKSIVESFRDWGRDCWCSPGKDNTCGKRYGWQLGGLPKGYDHKYTYSHMGYNLKLTDMQAAVGLSQLDSLIEFIDMRKQNFQLLKKALGVFQDLFILPDATSNSEPAWFGFPITLREGVPFSRGDLLKFLGDRKIGTRLLFGGNLTKQPYMNGKTFYISGDLKNSDIIMERTFWVGVYPAMDNVKIDYIKHSIQSFVAEFVQCR